MRARFHVWFHDSNRRRSLHTKARKKKTPAKHNPFPISRFLSHSLCAGEREPSSVTPCCTHQPSWSSFLSEFWRTFSLPVRRVSRARGRNWRKKKKLNRCWLLMEPEHHANHRRKHFFLVFEELFFYFSLQPPVDSDGLWPRVTFHCLVALVANNSRESKRRFNGRQRRTIRREVRWREISLFKISESKHLMCDAESWFFKFYVLFRYLSSLAFCSLCFPHFSSLSTIFARESFLKIFNGSERVQLTSWLARRVYYDITKVWVQTQYLQNFSLTMSESSASQFNRNRYETWETHLKSLSCDCRVQLNFRVSETDDLSRSRQHNTDSRETVKNIFKHKSGSVVLSRTSSLQSSANAKNTQENLSWKRSRWDERVFALTEKKKIILMWEKQAVRSAQIENSDALKSITIIESGFQHGLNRQLWRWNPNNFCLQHIFLWFYAT